MGQTSGDTLKGYTRFFAKYSSSYKIISETPNRLLKTQNFEKKGNLSSEEKILAYCICGIEFQKPQGIVYRGPQGFLTISVEVTRSFL